MVVKWFVRVKPSPGCLNVSILGSVIVTTSQISFWHLIVSCEIPSDLSSIYCIITGKQTNVNMKEGCSKFFGK